MGRRRPVAGVRGALGMAASLLVLTACASPSGPAGPAAPAAGTPSASPRAPDVSAPAVPPRALPSDAAVGEARARCDAVISEAAVRGLLGGRPVVTGGKQRVTGSVTQTRCTWEAENGRYLTVTSLDGPGLPARAKTVTAGATPVEGRPGVLYDARRGLIVTVDERLHQVVAGGAGTAQARMTGLKAIEAIRAGG